MRKIRSKDTKLSLFIDNAVRAKHLTNTVFARKIRMKHDEARVSRWRRGFLCPPVHKLPIIAEVLGVNLNELTDLWRNQKCPGRAFLRRDEIITQFGTVKVRLLLHFYEGTRFLGQTLPEIELEDFDDLQRAVIDTYPGTKINLLGIPTNPSKASLLMRLPSLREGYSHETVVKVMQVILLPS